MDPKQQLELIEQLKDNYLDNMEGCEWEEFIKWERLFCAAALIAKAMYEDMKDGAPL